MLKDRASKDDNGAVRKAAVQELARGWKDDPGTLPLLKDRASKDEDNDVRQAAVQELARTIPALAVAQRPRLEG
ncbi:MAG: HEAT repeat domain-containing protein [Acidobacteria bacterium]|nr:HEAT repeat domain-containing protein [Acidobacteriota bacterium]